MGKTGCHWVLMIIEDVEGSDNSGELIIWEWGEKERETALEYVGNFEEANGENGL